MLLLPRHLNCVCACVSLEISEQRQHRHVFVKYTREYTQQVREKFCLAKLEVFRFKAAVLSEVLFLQPTIWAAHLTIEHWLLHNSITKNTTWESATATITLKSTRFFSQNCVCQSWSVFMLKLMPQGMPQFLMHSQESLSFEACDAFAAHLHFENHR